KNNCQERKEASKADVPTFLECPYWFLLTISEVMICIKWACPYFFMVIKRDDFKFLCNFAAS
ncbi:MAG: hypothetical protein K6A94_06615, partial [Bacteroidales bacterium]|nr:hypothetical protein [Bacteroidales bacterium]